MQLEGFERFIPKRGLRSELSNLKIGEAWFFPEQLKSGTSFYSRLYQCQKKKGYVLEILKIKNGTVVKRVG